MISTRVIYVEPFSGISGDMFVGALLDLGADFEKLQRELRLLPLSGYEISLGKCLRGGVQVSKFDVQLDAAPDQEDHHTHRSAEHHHRDFRSIRRMIASSELPVWVREKSIEAFSKLASAEGKIHAQSPETVHFHEVGAVDSIVDIVSSMILMEDLLPARVLSAPINVGYGTLECQHGVYPVPGPATQELLAGVPIFSNAIGGELTTPTGAALLTTLAESFGTRPLMKINASGYGGGSRDIPGGANFLRITVGEPLPEQDAAIDAQVAVIEATIDDMNPQLYGYLQEKVLQEGAFDIYFTPVQMKKNRPAVKLTVLCAVEKHEALCRLIFAETTTIGVRYTFARRKTLDREFVSVHTEYGTVTIKVSMLEGRRVNFVPEYEDCRRLAAERGIALKDVLAVATRAYLEQADLRGTPSSMEGRDVSDNT